MLLQLTLIAQLFILHTKSQQFLDNPSIYQVTEPFDHSEGPIWDPRRGLLYFVDIHSGGLQSYNYTSGHLVSLRFPGDVSVVTPSKSDPEIILFAWNRSVAAFRWDGVSEDIGEVKVLTTVAEEHADSRLNEGKADKEGRLWYGTMGYQNSTYLAEDEGIVYLITKDNLQNPDVRISPVTISNGLAWNKANDKFYYIDSPKRNIVQYDYQDSRGVILNEKVLFDQDDYPTLGGHPDGMTIDTEDNLWVALYGGGAVLKVDSATGELLQVIAIPAKCVTSVMFGGPDLDVLFVTTSRYSLTEDEKLEQPSAGAVFAITNTGSKGVEVFWADIIDEI